MQEALAKDKVSEILVRRQQESIGFSASSKNDIITQSRFKLSDEQNIVAVGTKLVDDLLVNAATMFTWSRSRGDEQHPTEARRPQRRWRLLCRPR